ncbi:MucR family transcriptional regulator [Methylobacterium sp. NEAU K]|uniref:MucR family transcriptional regulator n=1 Tax=Methylobacterium sp. NEAU K TaxID=3064946 RepID=UPI0027325FD9|nr:MucR family transcriptional regulator [Methylobacterium sp. NEAU K]MDP4006386.1 MucR family transcriptional regulator [Methylobacterium sp. NEAU K]
MNENTSNPTADKSAFIELATDIVAAYVSNNSVRPADLPALLADVHAAVAGLNGASASAEPEVERLTPGQIRKSIKSDALISFIDGKPYKTLKRHLSTHGMTFEEYRERFGLPRDYPATAASYSAQRSAMAKSIGLGQQRRNAAPKATDVAETTAKALKGPGRKKAAEPTAAPAEKPTRARKPKKAVAAK